MGTLLVDNATQIGSSFRIYILLIRMWTFTMLCNMLFWITHNLHTYVNKDFWLKWRELTSKKDVDLHITLKNLPRSWVKMISFEKNYVKYYPIHALHLQSDTEKLLCNHLPGHPCYQYLYNSHKYIYGVPKFSNPTSRVLYQCPTFIQAKMSKTPPVHATTCVATQPYQGL